MRAFILVAIAMTAFAGCSDPEPADTTVDCSLPENAAAAECVPDLEVDETTGGIRCVVIDAAVKPLTGVTVSTNVPNIGTQSIVTDSRGTCAFGNLPPGTYFLQASKTGYFPSQTSVEVVAGVAPPVTKIQLLTDLANTPYHQAYTFSGYIECSVTSPVIAGAICAIPNGNCVGGQCTGNVTNDNFIAFHPLDRKPDWIQHEMVWESTQQAGNTFQLVSSYSTYEQHQEGTYEDDLNATTGMSPLLLIPSKGDIDRTNVGDNGTGLVPRVFAGGADGTAVCSPVPLPGDDTPFCTFGTGATIEQSFTIYTHVFYGYQPTEGWRFSEDPKVPEPPQ